MSEKFTFSAEFSPNLIDPWIPDLDLKIPDLMIAPVQDPPTHNLGLGQA